MSDTNQSHSHPPCGPEVLPQRGLVGLMGGWAGIVLQPSSFRSWFWFSFCGCHCACISSDPVSKIPFGCDLWFRFLFLCLTGSFNEGLAGHKPNKGLVPWIFLGGLIDLSRCALHPRITFGAAASANEAAAPNSRIGRTSRALRTVRAYRMGRALHRRGGGVQPGRGQVLQKIRCIKRADATDLENTQYVFGFHCFRKGFCPQINK